MTKLPPIQVSLFDLDRLERVLEIQPRRPEIARLADELGRAEVVAPERVRPDVVTMNSRVRYRDETAGVEREVTVVFPAEADVASARVSVLAPVGSALLGLAVGDTIDWPMPEGRSRRLRVVSVPYQPEAAGHFHL